MNEDLKALIALVLIIGTLSVVILILIYPVSTKTYEIGSIQTINLNGNSHQLLVTTTNGKSWTFTGACKEFSIYGSISVQYSLAGMESFPQTNGLLGDCI